MKLGLSPPLYLRRENQYGILERKLRKKIYNEYSDSQDFESPHLSYFRSIYRCLKSCNCWATIVPRVSCSTLRYPHILSGGPPPIQWLVVSMITVELFPSNSMIFFMVKCCRGPYNGRRFNINLKGLIVVDGPMWTQMTLQWQTAL